MSNENFRINKFRTCPGIQNFFYYENKPIYDTHLLLAKPIDALSLISSNF